MNIRKLPQRLVERLTLHVNSSLHLSGLRTPEVECRFALLSEQYRQYLLEFSCSGDETVQNAVLQWGDWNKEIADAFSSGVPLDFLRHPRISATMVYSVTTALSDRVANTVDTCGPEVAHLLLREDHLGKPHLADRYWLTSANRAHHANALANFHRHCGRSFVLSEPQRTVYVEWGGGYGDMARIIRRVNSRATYVIIDLPALSALQAVYLGSLEGEAMINRIVNPSGELAHGKINLLSPSTAFAMRPLEATHFLSTWALTESPPAYQARVLEKRFFGAKQVLLGYAIDDNNAIRARLEAFPFVRLPAGLLTREGMSNNEYAFGFASG